MTHAPFHHLEAIELAFTGDAAPAWVQLTPAGPDILARDGRTFKLNDPQAVVARFKAGRKKLMIDLEHASETVTPGTVPVKSYGWIDDMSVRDGAIWGHIDWTSEGGDLVRTKAYKYLSPGFYAHKETKELTGIFSAGLTHTPAFEMKELAKEAGAEEETTTMDKAIAEALGLASTATSADAVLKIGQLKEERDTASAKAPDPDKFVPKAQLDAANGKITEFEGKETARQEATFLAAVEAGIEGGKIAPAAKDGFLAMAKAQGVEKFTATVAAMPQIVGGDSPTKDKDPNAPANGALSTEEKEVARQLGQSEEDFLKAKNEEKSQ